MDTFVATCIGVLTLTHLVGLVLLVATLIQVQRSAAAMESLAKRAQKNVERLEESAQRMRNFAETVGSGWMKAVMLGLGAIVEFWPHGKSKGQLKDKDSGGRDNG